MAKIIVIDCDGVLTDGKIWVTSSGEKFKAFNAKDNRALAQLVAAGYVVYIVSASSWPGLASYVDSTGVIVYTSRDKGELEFLKDKKYIAIGDDAWDIQLLKNAVVSYCPRNASPEVLKIASYIIPVDGGNGVIAHFVERFLR